MISRHSELLGRSKRSLPCRSDYLLRPSTSSVTGYMKMSASSSGILRKPSIRDVSNFEVPFSIRHDEFGRPCISGLLVDSVLW